MRFDVKYFHCGDQLLKTLSDEIDEVKVVVNSVEWVEQFSYTENGNTYKHQTGYNRAFAAAFAHLEWEQQPLLREKPKLIGDFRKGFGLRRDPVWKQLNSLQGLLQIPVRVG